MSTISAKSDFLTSSKTFFRGWGFTRARAGARVRDSGSARDRDGARASARDWDRARYRYRYSSRSRSRGRDRAEVFHEKHDNLIVEADIFTIFRVSFYAMEKAFNFIEIKNRNIGEQFITSSIPLRHLFLINRVVVSVRITQKSHNCDGSIVIFNGCLMIFTLYKN